MPAPERSRGQSGAAPANLHDVLAGASWRLVFAWFWPYERGEQLPFHSGLVSNPRFAVRMGFPAKRAVYPPPMHRVHRQFWSRCLSVTFAGVLAAVCYAAHADEPLHARIDALVASKAGASTPAPVLTTRSSCGACISTWRGAFPHPKPLAPFLPTLRATNARHSLTDCWLRATIPAAWPSCST